VHEGREDRDEEMRELLWKRGVTVLSVGFEAATEEQAREAAQEFLTGLKLRGWEKKEAREP